jgi:glycerol uptake facilitator-like aquaporin
MTELAEPVSRHLLPSVLASIPASSASLTRRVVAEALGTALLLAAVVGSGIMGERLAAGHAGLALLANSLATGAALVALILTFGPISGAHFNPVVTLASAWRSGLRWSDVPWLLAAQICGALAGVMLANAMFGEPTVSLSDHVRTGSGQWLSEGVATFGLLAVITSCSRTIPSQVAYAVSAYIAAAYWFTASTSFANPAVTLARAITHTFAGIRLVDVPPFVAAQALGAVLAVVLFSWLIPRTSGHEVSSGLPASDRL